MNYKPMDFKAGPALAFYNKRINLAIKKRKCFNNKIFGIVNTCCSNEKMSKRPDYLNVGYSPK